MAENPNANLEAAFKAAIDWLDRANVPYVVIGGFAVGLVGRPRMTRDIDFVILADPGVWSSLLSSAAEFGLIPRISDPLAFARRARVLLLRFEGTGTDIDVSLGALPFEEEMINRSIPQTVAETTVRIPTPEDLIILKAIAHRAVDRGDIEGILDRHPDIDKERVRSWVRQFAEALERPELLQDIESLLRHPTNRFS